MGEAMAVDEALAGIFASDPLALGDPFPTWRAIREDGPVVFHGPLALVTSYEQVRALSKDNTRLSNRYFVEGTRARAIAESLDTEHLSAHRTLSEFEAMYISRADGDQHERLRTTMHRAFTPRRMAELHESIFRYTDEAIELAASEEVTDFRQVVAARIPIMVVADLLGVSQSDRDMIHAWADALARNRGGEDPEALMAAHAAMLEFRHYVEQEVIPARRDKGGSDLVRALLDAEGDRLTDAEVTAQFVVLLFAGFETTANLMGTGFLELLRHPDQWQLLCEDPAGRAENAVEELLRWISPLQWLGRVAVAPIEIEGTTIDAGQTVYLMLSSANRDPAAFESPETLDILRSEARSHLAFGLGPHFCLGNSLTRIEGRALFERLARRFPQAELADPAPPWGGNAMLRSLKSLPVRLSRSAQ